MTHWKVRFMRLNSEPPYPFGKTSEVVCADTCDEAKQLVPASPHYPITASKTTERCGFTHHCHCVGAAVAWRQWDADTRYYVAQLPGEDGVDWGYTTKSDTAIILNEYWQKRFAADCRRVGSEARFISCGREA